MKIGILTPRSNAYPELLLEFMGGLRTYLRRKDIDGKIQLITETIDFGGSGKEVYAKAEKLLILDQVDVLLAYIDEKVLDLLPPLASSSSKLIIVINPGANYPINWVPHPTIIHLTLQHSFCCWLTGSLAAKSPGLSIAASTFYDCGYLHAAAMVKSFEKRHGNIIFNYINNKSYDDTFNINELIDFLQRNRDAKNLLCQFDSLPASLLYKLLNNYKQADDLTLFVSPMMLEKKALIKQEKGFRFSLKGYLPWLLSQQNTTNIEFTETIQHQIKRDASIFSLLGWETAMVLEQVLIQYENNYTNGTELVDFLKKITLTSPRGELKLEDATQFYLSTPVMCSLNPGSDRMETFLINGYEEEWKQFRSEPTVGVVTGWTNTYLCY